MREGVIREIYPSTSQKHISCTRLTTNDPTLFPTGLVCFRVPISALPLLVRTQILWVKVLGLFFVLFLPYSICLRLRCRLRHVRSLASHLARGKFRFCYRLSYSSYGCSDFLHFLLRHHGWEAQTEAGTVPQYLHTQSNHSILSPALLELLPSVHCAVSLCAF